MDSKITKVRGGFNITRPPCVRCGEPPLGDEYACEHSQAPPVRRALSEGERLTITNGLRVAAERFQEHVTEFGGSTKPGLVRLGIQFRIQFEESIKLAELIEDADKVEVTI